MKVVAVVLALIVATAGGALALLHRSGQLPDWLPGVPAQPLAPVGEQRLSAHWTYGLALRPDHRLLAWGGRSGTGFVLGPKRWGDFAAPIATGTEDWRYISAGIAASYAITRDGQLLRRAMKHSETPLPYQPFFPTLRWIKVENKAGTSMGLTSDGRLKVWSESYFEDPRGLRSGYRRDYQVNADGTLAGSSDAELEQDHAADKSGIADYRERTLTQLLDYWGAQPLGLSDPRAVAALAELEKLHQDALAKELPARDAERSRYAARRGQPAALPVPGSQRWTDFCLVASGHGNDLQAHALDDAGTVWRIVFDSRAILYSIDSKPGTFTPQPLAAPTPFQRVYCGNQAQDATWLLDRDQKLWRATQQGITPFTDRRWRALASGSGFGIGIARNGDLMAWGEPYFRLILSQEAPKEPIVIDDDHDWQEVASDGGYLIARDEKGRIYTWGANGERKQGVSGLLADGGVSATRTEPRVIVELPP